MRRERIGVLLVRATAFGLVGCASVVREVRQDLVKARALVPGPEIEITLKNSFIQAYKNRATIEVLFAVDKADKHPHPKSLDGDLHVAGRAVEIGLPIVAEIENSASEPQAVSQIHRFEAAHSAVRLAGAWRLWSEHGGISAEIQGEHLSPGEVTNPDHVFEIHPVTRVGDQELLGSFRPVDGYRPTGAEIVIKSLENLPCRILRDEDTTSIVTRQHQFNDAEFLLEIENEPPRVVEDGRFVTAAIHDLKGETLARGVRMVFVKGTPPDDIVKTASAGTRLHVFGLPRINLQIVASRASRSAEQPEVLGRNLPYEFIVVGVYPDRPTESR